MCIRDRMRTSRSSSTFHNRGEACRSWPTAASVTWWSNAESPRLPLADPKRFGGATVLEGDVPAMIGSLDYGWNSFVVIATRGHKLDADCVLAAVQTNAQYIGL